MASAHSVTVMLNLFTYCIYLFLFVVIIIHIHIHIIFMCLPLFLQGAQDSIHDSSPPAHFVLTMTL